MTTTKTPTAPVPLGDYVTEFLLRGPRLDEALPRDGPIRREFDAVCSPFGLGIATAWCQHEAWLRAAAAKRNIQPRFANATLFFAEAIARDQQQKERR